MIVMQTEKIADQTQAAQTSLLALNNLHARETSYLAPETWSDLLRNASVASCIGGKSAFLIAFDHAATYDNFNFNWFRERLKQFIYIDRVVVGSEHRGQGLAKVLYDDLRAHAEVRGIGSHVCEVNVDPPNPGSDAFHGKMGFVEMGRVALPHVDKTVRYLVKNLD